VSGQDFGRLIIFEAKKKVCEEYREEKNQALMSEEGKER